MDRYLKIGRIGEGSFGKVYKATDKTTKGIVALKVIQTVIYFFFVKFFSYKIKFHKIVET